MLPDRSISIEQNWWKMPKLEKWDLADFQTMCRSRITSLETIMRLLWGIIKHCANPCRRVINKGFATIPDESKVFTEMTDQWKHKCFCKEHFSQLRWTDTTMKYNSARSKIWVQNVDLDLLYPMDSSTESESEDDLVVPILVGSKFRR